MLQGERILTRRHRLDVGVDAVELTLRVDRHGAVIDFENLGRAAGQSSRVGQRELGQVGIVETIVMIVPVNAAEGTAGQFILHQVEVLAVAAANFPFAVAANVPGAADERSDLIAPAEADRVWNITAVDDFRVRREEFVLESDTQIEGDVLESLPGILDVEAMVAAADLGVVTHAVAPVVVTVGASDVLDAAAADGLT